MNVWNTVASTQSITTLVVKNQKKKKNFRFLIFRAALK